MLNFMSEGRAEKRATGLKVQSLLYMLLLIIALPSFAQVNTGGTATTANHQKQVIGYITQWDAWKAANAGLPAQGALTHLNIDYSKYTILNFSFFGVASDGSLHSGDLRNKNIYQQGATQAPGDLFFTDPYSSWDLHILFGELEYVQHISAAVVTRAAAQGFQVQENSATWSHPGWRATNKALPLPLHKEGGAPGLLELAHSKGVKVMASIGGWSMCKHFPEMAADPAKRQRFIDDCKRLIALGFDGIDLDWEYPGPYAGMNFTGTQADYANFTTLVSEIRSAIGPNKLITAAFSADPVKLQGFQWSQLNNIMNYYNMMTYDFNGGWSNKAGHNAPLHNYDNSEAPTFNWQSCYDGLVALGVAKNKINMGAPFYGRGVICQGAAALNGATSKRSETVQPDGPITTCADYVNWPKDVYDGTPNYFYIKQKMAGGGWTRKWDDQAKVPYLTNGNYFLSYDDEESIGHKAQFIVNNQLAGTIVWTVYGDLELSGTPTQFGTKLIRFSSVKSDLVNKINAVFATGSNGLPTVSITAPTNGTTVTPGSNVVVNATASDSNGSITKVEFLLDGTKLGEDTSSPYSYTISNIAAGSHTILARATDNSGNTATSSVSITASTTGGNQAPSVSITAPSNGQVFSAGSAITISANASDPDGNNTISKVEFFQGSTKLGEATSSPYSYSWASVGAGSYTLTAKVTDNGGLSATSAAVSVTVNGGSTCSVPEWSSTKVYLKGDQASKAGNTYEAKWWSQNEDPVTRSGAEDVWKLIGPCGGGGNVNPTVSIASPSNNSTYTPPACITISANASDSDGSVVKVEFFQGSTKLGEDTSAPYTYQWCNVGTGNYTLTVKATDNGGGTTTSSVIIITVGTVGNNSNFKVVGYMPSWSGTASEIQYSKLTHIMYAFIRPTTTGGLTALDNEQKLRDIVTNAHNNNVKVGIAVGGWSDLNNTDFQTMAANSNYRAEFVKNIMAFVDKYALDGVDIDWEYPIDGQDPANFSTLMSDLANALHARGKFLTAAVSAQGYYAGGVLASVFPSVDFLNLMVYDGGSGADHSPYSYAVSSLDYWINQRGLPASKAVLGVPFYARPSWKAFRTLVAEGANPNADTYNGDYYNGIATIKAKTNLAFDRAIGGMMIWELSQDATGVNSLLSAIKEVVDQRSGGTGNTAPTVSITGPSNGATFNAPASITITANASDNGSVTKVEFFNGGTKLGEDTSSPYSYVWNNVGAGNYTIVATATDNEGATASSSVSITVNTIGTGGCNGIAQYVENGGYVGGSKVQNAGSQYECKPYPFSGWCNGAAWAYAPGTGAHWQDAWILKGSCAARSATAEVVEESFDKGLALYPNPAEGGNGKLALTFETDPGKVVDVKLTNLNGVDVFTKTRQEVTDKSIDVNLPVLAQGFYIVHVQGEKRIWKVKYQIK